MPQGARAGFDLAVEGDGNLISSLNLIPKISTSTRNSKDGLGFGIHRGFHLAVEGDGEFDLIAELARGLPVLGFWVQGSGFMGQSREGEGT
jgi:hypothetical protein